MINKKCQKTSKMRSTNGHWNVSSNYMCIIHIHIYTYYIKQLKSHFGTLGVKKIQKHKKDEACMRWWGGNFHNKRGEKKVMPHNTRVNLKVIPHNFQVDQIVISCNTRVNLKVITHSTRVNLKVSHSAFNLTKNYHRTIQESIWK